MLASLASGSAGFASDGDSTGTLGASGFDVRALRRRGAAAGAGGAAGGVGGAAEGGVAAAGAGVGVGVSSTLTATISGICTGSTRGGSGLANTLRSLSTDKAAGGSGGGGSGAARVRSVSAIMAAMSAIVSAEPERVFLLVCGWSGRGEAARSSGPLAFICAISPFSNGAGVGDALASLSLVGGGETRGVGAGAGGVRGGGGGGTGTRTVRSGLRLRLVPGGAPQESVESSLDEGGEGVGAARECTMTECGEAGEGTSLSRSASTRACGSLGCARAMRLLMVGASRTDSAGGGATGAGAPGGAGEVAAPLDARPPPNDRSTPTRPYDDSNSSARSLSLLCGKCEYKSTGGNVGVFMSPGDGVCLIKCLSGGVGVCR